MTELGKLHNKIRSRLNRCLGSDRPFLARDSRAIGTMIEKGGPEEKVRTRLTRLDEKITQSAARKRQRRERIPALTYPDSLPIVGRKTDIIEAIRSHQVVVITGETGSGKTTQIPKMCLEAGRGIDGIIGCTQPRRIAAVTVSRRIAAELQQPLGASVGYKMRFEDRTNRDVHIKLMTDGILLMEAQADPYLNEYDTIIVDEAHERSINIDFILGILKTLLKKRKNLKVIITSATIDPEKFARAFDNAPIIEVSGRLYPVEVRYRPIDQEREERGDTTYVDAAVSAVGELRRKSRQGDILVFMPTERDIRETCDRLAGKRYSGAEIHPLFARLSSADQMRIFAPAKGQKIVVATNVAETSITIPGIRYVVDTGLARISEYNSSTRTKRLPIKDISQSSALQRQGRCGRIEKGVCVRLYSEDDYIARPAFTPPEILRSNLAEVILRMVALRIGDIATFPFIDRPTAKTISDGFNILTELGAIRREKGRTTLTEKGRKMARMPIDPRIARMVIEAERQHCVAEVVIIASALSIQDPRERPFESEAEADEVHKPFVDARSDFYTLLNIWNAYHGKLDTLKTQNRMRKFCKKHFLSYRRMREWRDVHEQITLILGELGISRADRTKEPPEEILYERIHKSILSGYLSNIALKKEKNLYRAAKGRNVMLFPGSGIFNRGGEWVVSAEVVETSKVFARTAATIRSTWLEETGKDLCRSTYSNPRWDRERGEVVAAEQVTLFGLPIVTDRTVPYGPVNPGEAMEIFIRQGLVPGKIKESFPFLIHNRTLIDGAVAMEDKLRKRNILASEDLLAAFYAERLAGVYDIRTLRSHIDERDTDDFLKMDESDIVQYHPGEELAQYPDEISLDDRPLTVAYRFDPGTPEDGVTVKVPAHLAPAVPLESVDWHIPGFLKEKIAALIRGLPKDYRKRLVPIPRTVETIAAEMKPSRESLLASLADFIHERFGVDIPATAWPLDNLPDYLKTRFSLIDNRGRELHAGRDMETLMQHVGRDAPSKLFEKASKSWSKSGCTAWDFGDIPEYIELRHKGKVEGVAYPALERGEGSVNLRLFRDRDDARQSHEDGVAALMELHFRKELKVMMRYLKFPQDMSAWARYLGGAARLEKMTYHRILQELFHKDLRTGDAFKACLDSLRPAILPAAQDSLDMLRPVLKAYHETRDTLSTMEHSNRANRTARRFIDELRGDLNRLVSPDFISRYDHDKLARLPRHLQAITIRAGRGIHYIEKDRAKAEKLKVFMSRLEELQNDLPGFSSREKRDAVTEYYWMIEEYKISLFAPEMKTLHPVSPKRLSEKLKEIERMV